MPAANSSPEDSVAAQPPCDLAAEEAVLGSILKRPDVIAGLELQPADFYSEPFGDVFAAMLRLHASGRPIDFVTLQSELGDSELGMRDLAGIDFSAPTATHAGFYAASVREHARRRRLIHQAQQLAQAAWHGHDTTAVAADIHSSALPVVPNESNLPFRTARQIGESAADGVPWIARPWLARGSLTEVDAKLKVGKTEFIAHLCRAVLDGRPFIGEPCSATPIVYLSEQLTATFRETLRRADLLERDDFHVLQWHDVAGLAWSAIVQGAVAFAVHVGAAVLVVDTLPQFAGLKGDAENNAGDALAAIQPLQVAAAAHDLAVLIVRHDRKSGGDVGDSARGSSAFGGAVDVVIQMRRPEGGARPTIRVLSALSRFDETPETLVIERTDHGYVALGTQTAYAEQEARAALLEAAPGRAEDALATGELLQAAGNPARTIAYRALEQLVQDGRLERLGKGKKGDPHRYWRPPGFIHSSVLKCGVADELLSPQPTYEPAIRLDGFIRPELPDLMRTNEFFAAAAPVCELCEEPLEDPESYRSHAHAGCLEAVS